MICTYVYVHIYIHIYIHVYTHTYIHIKISSYPISSHTGCIPGSVKNVWEEPAKSALAPMYCRYAAPAADSRPEIEKNPWYPNE